MIAYDQFAYAKFQEIREDKTMAKFLFLIRGAGCSEQSEMTPEQMEAGMKAWMDWVKNGTDEGWLLDPGSGLHGEGAVIDSEFNVIDGPFAESKELVGGYSIVEATDLAAACEFAKQTMKLAGSGKIEVRELAQGGDAGE